MFKNKILEAVNHAVYNVLSTDIQDQDIDFDTADIDNDFNLMNDKVQEFIQHPSENNYKDIKEYYKLRKHRYIVKDLNELQLIFDKVSLIQRFNIDWLDFDNVITLIKYSGEEIPYYEYKKGMNVEFIKIYGRAVAPGCDDMIINKNLRIKQYVRWYRNLNWDERQAYKEDQCIYPDKNNIWHSMNGIELTYNNINIPLNSVEHKEIADIFMHVKELDINGFKAYIPAIGQLLTLYEHMDLIDYILLHINGTKLDRLVNRNLWSSTERDWLSAYYLTRVHKYTGCTRSGYEYKYDYSWSGDKQQVHSDLRYNTLMSIMPFFIKK